jgi:acetoacetyl-CoA reductase
MTQGKPDLAIVTGAARGIGAALAARLAVRGWRVVGMDRRWEGLRPTALVDGIELDVSDHKAVAAAVATIEAGWGPVGAVVNNAGITRDAVAHRMDPDSEWTPVIAVNLTGPFNLCRAVLPGMRERGYGRIVNLSSMNALKGQVGQANYAAAKAGLIGMTKSIALENAGKGITANCIAPGFIDTDMTRAIRADIRAVEAAKIPVGRLGAPDDIAALAAYLLSDEASFITGQVISVNGGQLMP